MVKANHALSNSDQVNMADNVNDKGDFRTIQQIVRAVVANLNFIKGEALRLLRTNSSTFTFEENVSNFKTLLQNRDYPARIVEKHLLEIKFSDREISLEQKNKTAPKKILPFVTQYHPALPNLKDTLMGKWHLIENQPQLREIFKEPPIISYRKGKSLKDILVKAKL